MNNQNISHTFNEDESKVILNSSEWMKKNQPILSDFIDGIEIDLEALSKLDIWFFRRGGLLSPLYLL